MPMKIEDKIEEVEKAIVKLTAIMVSIELKLQDIDIRLSPISRFYDNRDQPK